ncbi:MAG: hypothetical protein HUU20_00450 [Pirellulales bacterium]|nr:hypothetical protein [Pirellulales bacterium]
MRLVTATILVLISATRLAADIKLDQSPARPDEWGYRPEAGAASEVNPPPFSWRPHENHARFTHPRDDP